MDITAGFPPILGPQARVLILGTLPSQQSLKKGQYYGHPQNAFWDIMGQLFAAGRESTYDARTQRLLGQGIAVWDVLASGNRPGSMDAAIDKENAVPNDFAGFHAAHPELVMVCFNGQSAARMFRQLVPRNVQDTLNSVQLVTMPSTSPAYAAMSFEEKLQRWAVMAQAKRYKSCVET